jgi:hypothetical protein
MPIPVTRLEQLISNFTLRQNNDHTSLITSDRCDTNNPEDGRSEK